MRATKSIKETLITLIIDNTEPGSLQYYLSPTYPEVFSKGGLLFDIGDGSDDGGGGGGGGASGGDGGDSLDTGGDARRGFKFAQLLKLTHDCS